MIDIDEYLVLLDEDGETREELDREKYQRELFESYVLRNREHLEERQELLYLYRNGQSLTGLKVLR